MGNKLLDTGLGNDFLDLTLKAQATNAKPNIGTTSNQKASAQQRKPLTK